MRSKPQHYWFYDELFLFNFRLVWPVTEETLRKYIEDEFEGETYDDDFRGGKALFIPHKSSSSGTYIVALGKWRGNADNHSSLVHECNHAALMILEHRHVEMTTSNDESFAYLSAYLVRKCLNVLLPKRLRVEVDPKCRVKAR